MSGPMTNYELGKIMHREYEAEVSRYWGQEVTSEDKPGLRKVYRLALALIGFTLTVALIVQLSLEVHHQGEVKHAGPMDRTDDFKTFKQAKAALDQVVKDGLFRPVAERVFDYLVYADSLGALREWVDEPLSHLMIDDRVVRKVNELVLGTGGAAQVVLRRQVRVGRLKRV